MKRTFLGVVAIVIVGSVFILSSSAQGEVVRPSQPLPAVPLPDLVVSKISFTTVATIADRIVINVEIMNQGNAAAVIPSGKTLWLASKPSGGAVGPASKGVTIGPGSFFSYSFGPFFMAGELKPGTHDIKVTVDPENSLKESNKTNNQLSLVLVVFQNNPGNDNSAATNLAADIQRDYSQAPDYSALGQALQGVFGDFPSRSILELTSSRATMTAAEAFLNKRPVNSQAAGSAAGNLGVHAQNLENLIAELENIRLKIQQNKLQEFAQVFSNFDQKTNQLYNLIASVVKSMKDMQSGITRNML